MISTEPLPAIVTDYADRVWHVVIIAVTPLGNPQDDPGMVLAVHEDGSMRWWPLERVIVKVPPSSALRLAFGWAEKGPSGFGR